MLTLQPSTRRLGVAAALAALTVVYAYFLPFPHPEPASLIWLSALGFAMGYLMWPWFEPIRYPPGYFRPSPGRIRLALGIASIITAILAYLQIVILNDGVNVEGIIVTFLVSAFFIYVKLGSASRKRF